MKTKIERQNQIVSQAWNVIFNDTLDGDEYDDINCLANTDYNYRAFFVDEDGTTSEASNVVIGTTVPVTLSLAGKTLETLTFTWEKVSTATGYSLELSEDEQNWAVVYEGPGTEFDATHFMATVSGLKPGTQYYARMSMSNTSDTGGDTATVPARTESPIPGAPMVSFISSTESSIMLDVASTSSVV